jgi:hypothetical protein
MSSCHVNRNVAIIREAFAAKEAAELQAWAAECTIRGATENLKHNLLHDSKLNGHLIDMKDGVRIVINGVIVRKCEKGDYDYGDDGLADMDDYWLIGRTLNKRNKLLVNTWEVRLSYAKEHDQGLWKADS